MQILSVDDVLDITGHFGYSQLAYFFSIGSLQIFVALHMLLSIFVGLESPFICHMKDGTGDLINECLNNERNNCRLEYNSTFKSAAEEWDLVCEEKFKLPLIQSIWMGGVMAGALFLGGLADRIGRLMTLMVSLLCTIGFEAFSAFSQSYLFLLIFRFFGGVSCSLLILSGFVLSQELIGSSRRSSAGLLMSIFFSLGIVILSLLAAFLKDWRHLTLVSSIFGLCFVFIPCFVPESPRWLLGRGEAAKAKQILERMAQKNRTYHLLPTRWELGSPLGKKPGGASKRGSVLDLVSHPYIFMLTLILSYSWFVNSASYYALTMASSSLPGNIYMSTTLNGLVEIPAMLIGTLIIDRLGRRIAICASMLLSGLACAVIPLVSSSAVSICALVGKLCISASFAFVYIHSGEIYPTVIRNTGLGVVSVAARIGGIVSPFILTLRDIYPNLEFITLGILTLVAALLHLKLPETYGRPMPESIADIINMRRQTSKPLKKKRSAYARLAEDGDKEGLLNESFPKDDLDGNVLFTDATDVTNFEL